MGSEHTLILGPERHLVATITAPRPGQTTPQWMAVLTNSGVIGRAGPHRINVRLARQFAEMGIPSVRFDMSGLGDSKRASSNIPQVEQWVEDTRTVMDAAQAQFGQVRFFMVGLCSGAEVAHKVALKDERLRAAVLWDFYAFPTRWSRVFQLLGRLKRHTPQELLHKLHNKLTRTVRTALPSGGDAAAAQNMYGASATPREVYIGRFNELAGKGVELFFVYSGGEPDWFVYRGQFKEMFGGQPFYGKVAFDQLELCDHLITGKAAQRAFAESVQKWLEERVLSKP